MTDPVPSKSDCGTCGEPHYVGVYYNHSFLGKEQPSSKDLSIAPCPFCGARNVSVVEGDTFRWRIAQCNECEAQAPVVRIQTMGEGTPAQWEERARVDAIAEWNKRHTPEPGQCQPIFDRAGRCGTCTACGANFTCGAKLGTAQPPATKRGIGGTDCIYGNPDCHCCSPQPPGDG